MRVTPGLWAPESYQKAAPVLVREIVNGCGAGNARFDFVPDTILFMSISECCSIHDWMYSEGRTLADKDKADRTFLNNICRLIERNTKWLWLKKWRRIRAREYYEAVRLFGGSAFWDGKAGGPTPPDPDEYHMVSES